METQNETQFLNGLGELKQSLDANTLQLRMIQRQIEQLSKFSQEENYEYLKDLMHPETRPGCKIPSRVPIPSTTFQLKSVATLITNNKGNLLIKINPCFLAEESAVGKASLYVGDNNVKYWLYICPPLTGVTFANTDILDGETQLPFSETLFKTQEAGQIVPTGLYSSFRVVSASVKAKYVGPIEKASGICGGGICNEAIVGSGIRYYTLFYKNNPSPPAYDPSKTNYNTFMYGHEFSNFNNINHLVYSYQGSCLDGIRLLYFPTDNKYDEFCKLFTGDYKLFPKPAEYPYNNPAIQPVGQPNKFWWLIYFQGLPVSSSCVRLELTINYELMPSEKYLNYMPISINPVYIDSKMRRKLLMQVASKAVTKNTDQDEYK